MFYAIPFNPRMPQAVHIITAENTMHEPEHKSPQAGATTGTVRSTLRVEGLAVLLASTAAYARYGAGWQVFCLFFLLPDLSLAGYLAGPRVGAFCYNVAHSAIGALACLALSLHTASDLPLIVGLIWSAHIGFDRALGYGLKYSRGFAYTHLGRIGRPSRPSES
jgi:hypothetical protein